MANAPTVNTNKTRKISFGSHGKRKWVHAKTTFGTNPRSKNYRKPYAGQGR